MKNHYGKNTQWFLNEAFGTLNELNENGNIPNDFEVYGEGDSFCMVETTKLIESAASEIDTLTEQVKQLREALECMVLKFAYQDFDTSPLPTNEQQEEVAHAMELLEVTK